MDESASPVKGRRAYDGSRRREAALRTRAAVLDAALVRFLREGYVVTTIESIALDAGVSDATIYKTFGGKPGLVRALCERALAGEGSLPAEQRSDALQETEVAPRAVIDGWGRLTAEVAPRIAPILLLLRDAANADRAAADLYDELDANRLARMSANARYLADGQHLRAGVRLRDARDVLWIYSSPEFFDMLVRRRQWSVRRYSQFVSDSIASALL
jgi:AcrR family transcriptional regulator